MFITPPLDPLGIWTELLLIICHMKH